MVYQEASIYDVTYTSIGKGETTERTIIPLAVPNPVMNIKALDVSELSEPDQKELAVLVAEYNEYKVVFMAQMYNFDNWLEHTTGETKVLKYRTFAMENLELTE